MQTLSSVDAAATEGMVEGVGVFDPLDGGAIVDEISQAILLLPRTEFCENGKEIVIISFIHDRTRNLLGTFMFYI